MNVEIFALCDAATADAAGKLNILGVFDNIFAQVPPIVHNFCSLAIRMRFERVEVGNKALRIAVVDADGTEVFPTLQSNIEVQVPEGAPYATVQIVLQIQRLTLPRFGEYQIDLAVDGRVERSIPLFGRKRP